MAKWHCGWWCSRYGFSRQALSMLILPAFSCMANIPIVSWLGYIYIYTHMYLYVICIHTYVCIYMYTYISFENRVNLCYWPNAGIITLLVCFQSFGYRTLASLWQLSVIFISIFLIICDDIKIWRCFTDLKYVFFFHFLSHRYTPTWSWCHIFDTLLVNIYSKRYMHIYVHGSAWHNSQNMKRTQMSNFKWMVKNLWHIYKMGYHEFYKKIWNWWEKWTLW